MLSGMAITKTIRLRSDLAAWLETTAARVRLSQNRLIEALIENAMQADKDRQTAELDGQLNLFRER